MSGLTAGIVGQFLSSPTDLVKVRMQMNGLRAVKTPDRSLDEACCLITLRTFQS